MNIPYENYRSTIASTLVILTFIYSTIAQPDPNSPWVSITGGSMGRLITTSTTTFNSTHPLRLLWSYTTNGQVGSSPIIGADGTVYIGSDDGYVYALNGSTGVLKWKYATTGLVRTAPTIGNGGWLYISSVSTTEYLLYALNSVDGSLRWKRTDAYFEAGYAPGFPSSPVIGTDGTVYLGSWSPHFYAIDGFTGNLRWTFNTNHQVSASAIVTTDTVYMGCYDGKMYAVYVSNGNLRWSFATNWGIVAAAALRGTTLFVSSQDTNVYALDAITGQLIWKFSPTGPWRYTFSSIPAVSTANIVYVGCDAGDVYAFDGSNGNLLWKALILNIYYSSAAISFDGTIYIGSFEKYLNVINPINGSIQWRFKTEGSIVSSPAINKDGIIYFGSNDGKVYAVHHEPCPRDHVWLDKDIVSSQSTCSPLPSVSATPSATTSGTNSATQSAISTLSSSASGSNTPSVTNSGKVTESSTISATISSTATASSSSNPTFSSISTVTASTTSSGTSTSSATSTASMTSSSTSSSTITARVTPSPWPSIKLTLVLAPVYNVSGLLLDSQRFEILFLSLAGQMAIATRIINICSIIPRSCVNEPSVPRRRLQGYSNAVVVEIEILYVDASSAALAAAHFSRDTVEWTTAFITLFTQMGPTNMGNATVIASSAIHHTTNEIGQETLSSNATDHEVSVTILAVVGVGISLAAFSLGCVINRFFFPKKRVKVSPANP